MKNNKLPLICLLIGFLLFSAPLSTNAADAEEPLTYDKVAENQLTPGEVGVYGMVPIYGFDIKDGIYPVEVESSSTKFRIIDATLTVKDGNMEADITLNANGYLKLFPGTAKEAAASDVSSYLDFELNENGKQTYHLSVPALNMGIDCAAFSKDRQQWYDRKILFTASSLPADAIAFEVPDYSEIEKAMIALKKVRAEKNADKTADTQEATETADNSAAEAAEQSGGTVSSPLEPVEPVTLDMEDGEYSIEMYLEGGSGKASVVTPNVLTIRNGKAYASIQWSSSNYDYMIVGTEKYFNQSEEGVNSTFEIPIAFMDEGMPVIADTTAMGEPREIRYTLTFYSESIGAKSQMPQEAAKRVVFVAFAIIIGGGILNYFVKKKRRV